MVNLVVNELRDNLYDEFVGNYLKRDIDNIQRSDDTQKQKETYFIFLNLDLQVHIFAKNDVDLWLPGDLGIPDRNN